MGTLERRCIVVTGGSSGLGRAMAIAFAREGAAVYIGDVRRDPRSGGRATDEEIVAAGGHAEYVPTDTSKWDDICTLFDRALEYSGRVDVLVNSAVRVGNHSKGLLETTEEDWDAMMDVNLRGVFLCCKRAVAQMLAQEPIAEVRGRIVNMASTMGVIAARGHVAYCAGKGGVVNLTRQIGVDFAQHGIIVNGIAPGKVPTNPLDAVEGDEDDMDYILARTPYPRLGRPEDVAGLALYLASDACQFVSGAIIPVDGGWLAY